MSFLRLKCIKNNNGRKMKQTPGNIKTLIEKYLQDQCSEEERYHLLQSLDTPGGEQALEEAMDKEAADLFRSQLAMDPEVSKRILHRLQAAIRTTEPVAMEAGSIPFYKRITWPLAASVAGILFLAALGLMLLREKPHQTFTTHAGQKRTVILEDGSRVTLNASSAISFSNSGPTRELLLDGEAYFDIAHDPSRPFYVKTSRIEIKVLGTAFNVKSYPGEETVEATLIRGRVLVKNLADATGSRGEIELKPNEQAIFKKESASLAKITSVASPEKQIWHRGNLMFEEESIRVILPELEKWYNVKITADKQSLDCSFSMNIGEESLADLLHFLETTTRVRAVQRGNEINLEGSLCN